VKSVAICGGVSASMGRRTQLQIAATEEKLPSYRPMKILYSTDNAAMIGLVGIMMKMSS
jgi:tRNA A37 threonylcarbamoyltransferase TsaD